MAWFVNAEQTVEQRVITTGSSLDNYWIVTAGVNVGDQVVIDGLQKIREGASVATVEVEINSDGVVNQALPSAGGEE
jgi:membrane fusion protein (multidrug efflux system)